MNYATIKPMDIANGVGVRTSLFVSGCSHRCKGCFNSEAWDFDYGSPYTKETEKEIIKALEPDYICGFSLLGGEPFDPRNQEELVGLLRKIKSVYPQKTVWCYTGYDFEEDFLSGKLEKHDRVMEMLSYIDILVDGRFIEELKNLNIRFRGSENQRIIDVKKSLESNKVVLWEDEKENAYADENAGADGKGKKA